MLVLKIYNDDALTDYFVMENGEAWGLDFAEEDRAGDWHFRQFDTGRNVRRTAIADPCVSCHQGAAETDFMFTWGRLQDSQPPFAHWPLRLRPTASTASSRLTSGRNC